MIRATLIRHGHAGDAALDAERALTEKGRLVVRAVADRLREDSVRFDRIISSPLVRAVQTAEIVAERLDFSGELLVDRVLVPEGDPGEVWALVTSLIETGSVALVGHQPLLSSLATFLLGQPFRGLRKGEAVRVRLPDGTPGTGELRWYLDPKSLDLVKT